MYIGPSHCMKIQLQVCNYVYLGSFSANITIQWWPGDAYCVRDKPKIHLPPLLFHKTTFKLFSQFKARGHAKIQMHMIKQSRLIGCMLDLKKNMQTGTCMMS